MTRTVDTRFFIRYFTAETDKLRDTARKKMHDLENESAVVPTIVIHELYKHQFQTLGRETAELRTALIVQSGLSLVELDVDIAKKAAELRCKYSELPTADAIIAGTAIRTRSLRVVTDDAHLRQVEEIKTEWI